MAPPSYPTPLHPTPLHPPHPPHPTPFAPPSQVSEGSFLKKALFNWGYQRKLHFLNKGLPYDKVGRVQWVHLERFDELESRVWKARFPGSGSQRWNAAVRAQAAGPGRLCGYDGTCVRALLSWCMKRAAPGASVQPASLLACAPTAGCARV